MRSLSGWKFLKIKKSVDVDKAPAVWRVKQTTRQYSKSKTPQNKSDQTIWGTLCTVAEKTSLLILRYRRVTSKRQTGQPWSSQDASTTHLSRHWSSQSRHRLRGNQPDHPSRSRTHTAQLREKWSIQEPCPLKVWSPMIVEICTLSKSCIRVAWVNAASRAARSYYSKVIRKRIHQANSLIECLKASCSTRWLQLISSSIRMQPNLLQKTLRRGSQRLIANSCSSN